MPNTDKDMHSLITPSDYIKMCNQIYTLIKNEITESKKSSEPHIHLPQLIIMHEFFKFLRGEAFQQVRAHVGEFQKDLYKMEDELLADLNNYKNSIDTSDRRVFATLESYKNLFNL